VSAEDSTLRIELAYVVLATGSPQSAVFTQPV
jgi:hypothetical protein